MTDQEIIDCLRRNLSKCLKIIEDWVLAVVYHRNMRVIDKSKRVDPEDVVFEVNYALAKKLKDPGFRVESSLKALIQRIAECRWIDIWRRDRNVDGFLDDEQMNIPDPDDIIDKIDRVIKIKIIHRGIEKMDDKCKSVLRMADVQGMSRAEMAMVLSVEVNNVKVILNRCREKLRKM